MNKLIPVLLALGAVAASAQPAATPTPITMRIYTAQPGGRFGSGLEASAHFATLGLRVESGDWHFDLAVPEASPTTALPLAVGPRGFRRGLGDFAVGIGRSFGATARHGALWDLSNFSLGLNYRIESSALPEGPTSRSVGLSYGYQITPGLRLNSNLDRGLSDGASKWGGGLSISFSH